MTQLKSPEEKRAKFRESLGNHQIRTRGIDGFPLPVTLLSSENPYIAYPAKGVMRIMEQGTDLSVIVGVFHHLKDDGSLGAPVSARLPVFTYRHPAVPEDAPEPRMRARVRTALAEAEAFISGFEDDDVQEGIALLLGKLRTLLQENPEYK